MSGAAHNERRREKLLVFGAPTITEAEIDEVVDSMRAAWIGTGPKVARFEDEFRRYKGAEHVVAVASCTAAMHLALAALDLEPGDEVITTPMTFCATVNAILHAGGTPVLADVDPRSQCIDPRGVEAAITDRTRAILPVHFAGRSCEISAISDIASARGLRVIEDCAHAIETLDEGRPAGTVGDFGCFSFYATKNVTTAEGGMVVCKNADEAARIKRLSLHGLSADAWRRYSDEGYKHYSVTELGFKYNMTDLQAAIGIHQLARVEQSWSRRLEIWNRYNKELADLPLTLPSAFENDRRHALHLYTVLVEDDAGVSRDAFLSAMQQRMIGVGVHYLSVPEHPYYQQALGWDPARWPVARDIGRRTISLPLSPGMTDSDVDDVVWAVRDILSGGR